MLLVYTKQSFTQNRVLHKRCQFDLNKTKIYTRGVQFMMQKKSAKSIKCESI